MTRTTLARLAFACAPCREVIQFLNVRHSESVLPWSDIYAIAAE